MIKSSILAVIFTTLLLAAKGQNYPKNYFTGPLDPPLVLTGTFGEIRDDHFHSGIDLSTGEEEGVPVMAAADGYISRIKISSDGYGKALYITHSNGYVTVYGHLQKFSAPLNAYVRKYQYENQVFECDLKPDSKEFPVKQRDVIAYSGSTGSAVDPHLHFEIRDEKSEEPVNPLLFGLPVVDQVKPIIKFVRIFPQREGGIVENTDSALTYDVRYDSSLNKLLLNAYDYPQVYGNISFGINAIDKMDTLENELGIYSCELIVDDNLIFSYKFDRFNFDNTREVNAHIDYAIKKRDDLVIEKCFKLPGDHLGFYGEFPGNGFVNLEENKSHQVIINVSDFSGNKSELLFNIISSVSLSTNQYLPKPNSGTLISNLKGMSVDKQKMKFTIPDDALFETFNCTYESRRSSRYLSDVIHIGDSLEPLRKPLTIGIMPVNEIEERLKSKSIIVRINETNDYITLNSLGGEWNGKMLTAKSSDFGDFAIVIDSIPPTIEKYYYPADMNTMFGGVVMITVKDDLSGIKSYSGKIDGQWHLFEYDKKSDMLIGNVGSMDVNMDHKIELSVTDKCGNTTQWKSSFWY